MPIQECQLNSKPGFRWGQSGTCYTHDGTDADKARAKKLAIKQALAISGGKITNELVDADRVLADEVEREYDDLETVDLKDVEILSAGGPVHGVGSPPEGDYWKPEDLKGMAEAAQELEAAGEWRIAAKVGEEPLGRNKIGHDPKQQLASSVSPGEMPAVGWLTNQHVSDDGRKLLTDITDVPRKLADLIKAKAYRTRSSELSSVTSQKTGKKYPWVVSGLAWLGGKMPAVRTLDDVVALYEGDDATRVFVQYEPVEEPSLDELRDAVAGLGADLGRAYSGLSRERVDSRPMPQLEINEEQTAELAEALGVEGDLTPEKLLEAAKAKTVEPEQKPEQRSLADEALVKLESKVEEEAEARKKLETRLYEQDRAHFIETDAIKPGKIEPGQREYLEALYDADPEKARKYVESLPIREDLVREFGSDGDDQPSTQEEQEEADRAYADEHERVYGERPMAFGKAS